MNKTESAILKLTSAEDIARACQELSKAEMAMQGELQAWLSKQRPEQTHDLFAKVDSLFVQEQSPDVAALRQGLDTLCVACAGPVEVARNVSSTVRAVATVEARVRETEGRVQELIDLKHCLSNVQIARESGDIVTAVNGIHRYLLMDSAVLDPPSRELLATTRTELQRALTEKLTVTLSRAQRDQQQKQSKELDEEVRTLCVLYGVLGLEDEGLSHYTQYIRGRIERIADTIFNDLRNVRPDSMLNAVLDDLSSYDPHAPQQQERRGAITSFGAGLTKICEAIAIVVQSLVCSDDATRPLWPGSVFPVLCEIQSLSDSLASRLCDMFYNCFGVNQHIAEIQSKKSADMKANLKNIGPMLDEMVLLCQTANVFDTFLRSCEKTSREVYTAWYEKQIQEIARQIRPVKTQPKKLESFQPLARSTELLRRSQELSANYLFLEEYNFNDTVSSILTSETLTVDTVELLFFVMNSSASRSVQTLNPSCVGAILNDIAVALSGPVYSTMEKAMKEAPIRGILKMRTLGDQSSQAWARLNNIDLVVVDIPKLCDSIQEQCEKFFAQTPATVQKLSSCLSDVNNVVKRFNVLLSECVEQQCRQFIIPRLRSMVENVIASRPTYVLSQEEYSMLDAGDTLFAQFGALISQIANEVESQLSPSNFEAVLMRAVSYAVEKIELLIFQRRFNQLGALQLDSDIRAFQLHLSSLSRRAIREKCTRLTQITLFLGVEQPSEAAQLWSSGTETGSGGSGGPWRLAPAEVKRVLSLRVEFRPDQLRQIAI